MNEQPIDARKQRHLLSIENDRENWQVKLAFDGDDTPEVFVMTYAQVLVLKNVVKQIEEHNRQLITERLTPRGAA